MRVSIVYDGVSAGWDRGGNPLPPLGKLRLDIVIPKRWLNGPCRELKLWFVDQYDRQFHGGALEKARLHSKALAEKERNHKEDEARIAKGLKPRKRRKNLSRPPTFNARECHFVKKDGSGVFDVDTISRTLEDGAILQLLVSNESHKKKGKPRTEEDSALHDDEGKGSASEEEKDKYKPSRLVGAAAGSLNARRRQRAIEKAELFDKLYDDHETKMLANADTEGIELQRRAVAAAHRAYNVKLTELAALGLTHEVRAYLRDEACDRSAILDKQNHEGDTPLALACMFGHVDTVKELLLAGADPDLPCANDDWTPMVSAARCANHEIVKMLLDSGADRSRNNIKGSIWAGDHVIKHSWNAIGRTAEDREKTTSLIRSYNMESSWIEVIDNHWNSVRKYRRQNGIGHPHEEFHRLAKLESLKNTKGLAPRYLPLQKASTLVRTKALTRDQLERLHEVWKLVSTVRQEDDAPQDGVIEGEKDPIMTKSRLLAALVDRRRNMKIQRILTGGQTLSEVLAQREKGLGVEEGLPSLLVILQPFLWKEAFLQMDSRLGAGKVAFDEFVSFVLVSDSPSGAGRATLRQIFDTLDLESPEFPKGRVPKSLLLRVISGAGCNGARGNRRARDWAIRALRRLPSLSILLKPSSWRKIFPIPRKIDRKNNKETERDEEKNDGLSRQQTYTGDNGLSLREEALLKIREEWGDKGEDVESTNRLNDGCITFGEFYDKCHLLASDVGKFVPVKDEAIAREEAEVLPGDEIKARWHGSRELYNARIIAGSAAKGYSIVYETGEYDAHVSSEMILRKDENAEELEMQDVGLMGDKNVMTAKERKLLALLNKK